MVDRTSYNSVMLPASVLIRPFRPVVALALAAAVSTTPRVLVAQSLTPADSALVGRILLAEDRRDSLDAALTEGESHFDARVRVLVQRARGRIRDPRLALRDALPPAVPPPAHPEPAWRLRFRALNASRDDCATLRSAVADSAWPVRLRAADLARASCAGDTVLVRTFVRWVDALPRAASRRKRGEVAWHAAAHAIVALARLAPSQATTRLGVIVTHRQYQLRQYAVRVAVVLADTALLRRLARDADDNVAEVAIEALGKLTGHADDNLFLDALGRGGAQVVRSAAVALKGSPRTDVAAAAGRQFERFVARANASEHDARVALLEAAGRPAADDSPPPVNTALPRDAVALALGAPMRLRVTLARSSGGGNFVVRLRGDVAPMMAARIVDLARAGYYDGLSWHRVEPDFVIQGGSPGANEYVGLPQFIRDELGTVSHLRGTVGMSTRGHDTGDAQWFVNLRDNARLDRDYTVWGEVVEGLGVVDGVLEGDVIKRIRVDRR